LRLFGALLDGAATPRRWRDRCRRLREAEQEHVLAGFENPPTPEALAQQGAEPMLRGPLYAACVAAMVTVNPAERLGLDRLGVALKLDAAARDMIEKRLA
jgi:uncharacterized membrane protein YebE (DUF533 family)